MIIVQTGSISEALGFSPGPAHSRENCSEVISIVGGGGKTTALFALLDEFACLGFPALALTTTRMAYPVGPFASDLMMAIDADPSIPAAFAASNPGKKILAAASVESDNEDEGEGLGRGKLTGYQASSVDSAACVFPGVRFIVEADGSRGMPLKAPGFHEPVIPSTTTVVVMILGAESLLKPVSPSVIHRFEIFSSISGLKEGMTPDPAGMAKVILGPEGYGRAFPRGCRICLLANRGDPLDSRERRRAQRFLVDLAGICPEFSSIALCSIEKGWYERVR